MVSPFTFLLTCLPNRLQHLSNFLSKTVVNVSMWCKQMFRSLKWLSRKEALHNIKLSWSGGMSSNFLNSCFLVYECL